MSELKLPGLMSDAQRKANGHNPNSLAALDANRTKNQAAMFMPGGGYGRRKGNRNALSNAFIHKLYEDFTEHGDEAIRDVRVNEPAKYLMIIAHLVPKEVHFRDDTFSGMTDEQIGSILTAIDTIAAGAGNSQQALGSGAGDAAARTIEGEAEEIGER